MGDILVRNLEPVTVERLKKRASRNGRSLQAEVSSILTAAAEQDDARERAIRVAGEMRARLTGRSHSDSTELIREDRDSR
jgi:plasmid stability protein